MADHHPDSERVQEVVAHADRRRRARSALAAIARVAPWAGAAGLGTAVVVRAAGASAVVTAGVLFVLAAAVATWFLWLSRSGEAPDVVAARVDADASMAGELRSAHWFARHPEDDIWRKYHVNQAAKHAGAVDWEALYPTVRAGRSWMLTGLGAVAAIAIAVTTPAVTPQVATAAGMLAASNLSPEELLDLMPPELRDRLQALLDGMAENAVSADAAQATLDELAAMMADMDPELSEQLAALAEQAAEMADAADASGGLKPPDDESNTAAGLPEDVRWAVEDLAERLADATDASERQTAEGNPAASEETGEMGLGSEQAQTEQAGASADPSMQLMREAASDPGAGKMMMAGAGAMGGDSGQGAGGNNPSQGGDADAVQIAQALRQELIEASSDAQGENITAEDIRRKTEQGRATTAFTQVPPPPSVDRSRVAAPPIVPDARRLLMLNYFIRRQ